MSSKKKGAGGKLKRNQVITVRLDPKLKFGAELAARRQRRTLSSYIEWAIEQSLQNIKIDGIATAFSAMNDVWHVEEADKFINFAFKFPELLNYDEERLWQLIIEHEYFWRCLKRSNGHISYGCWTSTILHFRVREQWETLHEIIEGTRNEDEIPEEPLDCVESDQPLDPEYPY